VLRQFRKWDTDSIAGLGGISPSPRRLSAQSGIPIPAGDSLDCHLECDAIFVNAKIEEGGSIVVEICDEAGVSIKGYGRKSAVVIGERDDVRIPVEFRGAGLAKLKGQQIRPRMHLERAGVYGLAFE